MWKVWITPQTQYLSTKFDIGYVDNYVDNFNTR